jgi:hypothetical protein
LWDEGNQAKRAKIFCLVRLYQSVCIKIKNMKVFFFENIYCGVFEIFLFSSKIFLLFMCHFFCTTKYDEITKCFLPRQSKMKINVFNTTSYIYNESLLQKPPSELKYIFVEDYISNKYTKTRQILWFFSKNARSAYNRYKAQRSRNYTAVGSCSLI